MKAIIIGYGNVGREVEKILKENNILIYSILQKDTLLDPNNLDSNTYIFICVPSIGTGEEIAHYYQTVLAVGAKIITCEKAFIAHHWHVVQKYKDQIRYSATVGGNSGILDAISNYPHDIKEIKAVVNGSLNYVGESLLKGNYQQEIFKDVIEKGYAEPGAKTFEEVIATELNDVLYKTAIIANHSGLYKKMIEPKDISLYPYKKDSRASVLITKNEIRAGFFENLTQKEFPSGVNNILYINSKKIVEGPGAGGKITAERMFKDFQELFN